MSERRRSPLNGGQVKIAQRYHHVLDTIQSELSEPFKVRELKSRFEDVGHGDLMKLKNGGLLRNESVATDEPKNWYLKKQTIRWLDQRRADNNDR